MSKSIFKIILSVLSTVGAVLLVAGFFTGSGSTILTGVLVAVAPIGIMILLSVAYIILSAIGDSKK